VVAEDRPSLHDAFTRAIHGSQDFDIDYRIANPRTGAIILLRSQGRMLNQGPGQPPLLIGVSQDITDRKETEANLRASQERYQTLFNAIDEGFCVIEVQFNERQEPVDYRFEEVNPAFERHTGLHNATGRWISDMIPDLEHHWFEAYGRVAATGTAARFVQQARALNERWFDVYAFPAGKADARRIALLFTDISERRRAEEAVRKSGERLHRAIEIETVGIVFFRTDGTIFDANHAFLRMTGYTREDIDQGLVRIDTLTPPEWRPALQHAAEELLVQGRNTPYEKEYQRKDGSRWWGLFAATRLDEDEAVKFIVDITAAKQSEAERNRLATIVASSRDAIVGVDMDGMITDWNRGAEELYGYTAREAVGMSIMMLIPQDRVDEWRASRARLQAGEQGATFETVQIARGGRRLDIELMLSPITDPAGKMVGMAGVARDATLRKQMERAQQDYLAMASHDLRTPMTVMRAQAQLLRRRKVYDEHSVNVILDQTRRMERLVADLQDAAKLEAGQLELRRAEVDAAELVHEAAERANAQSQQHHISVEAPPEPVHGQWDRDRIGQVLDNLLSNAIKYSPGGGDIVLRLEIEGDNARLSVIDAGVGIPEDVREQLFERFFRADEAGIASGLGLGLYITQMLVAAHGGRIEVASTPGRGSTFSVVIPLGRPA
jgi:PAS domain S-box-containing protein